MQINLDKVTTFFDKEPVCIEKYFLIGPVENPIKNDIFNIQLNKILNNSCQSDMSNNIELVNGFWSKLRFHNQLGSDKSVFLDDYKTQRNERIFLYSNIHSSSNKKIFILFTIYNTFLKLWINNSITVIGDDNLNDIHFTKQSYREITVVTELKKGNNVIFLELARKYEEYGMSISFRVSDYFSEIYQLDRGLANNYIFQNKKVFLIYNKQIEYNFKCFEFMLVPNDLLNVDLNRKAIVKLLDIDKNSIDEFEVKYYKKMTYDFTIHASISPVIKFEITVFLDKGSVYTEENIVFTDHINKYLFKANEDYEKINNKNLLKNEDEINIIGRLMNIQNEFKIILDSELSILSRLIFYVKKGFHFNDIVCEPGYKAVYFRSMLDYKIEKYYISIPNYYSNKEKYPLIIFLSTERYNLFSYNMKDYLKEPVIFADVSCRGVTMGSYIGEAAFLEIFELVKKTFSIDEDRVYLIGHSNGAFAAWSMAQSYPDTFAAIISNGGEPYEPNILNISNIGVLDYSTDFDIEFGLNKKKCENFNYKSIFVNKVQHSGLVLYMYNKICYEYLLNYTRVKIPDKIYFRTERIRHNKAYWVKIIEIDQDKKFAEVEAEIVGCDTLSLRLNNISSVIIIIPECLKENKYRICINMTNSFEFENSKIEKFMFQKKVDTYYVNELIAQDGIRSKGIGLLDVYMEGVNIIIPAEYKDIESKKIIRNIANNFAKPFCNGFIPEIFVEYPIYTEEEIKHRKYDSNLIIIGSLSDNKILNSNREKLPIQLNENGYSYNGLYYEEDYCIMLICKNPFNNEKKALIVYSNNIKLMKKNLFTRKIVFTSYFNGIHPYLNSDALIFNGQNYLVIDTFGQKINNPGHKLC